MHRKTFSPITLVLLLALLSSACAPAPAAPGSPAAATPTPGLEQIRLPMGYIPNVQFAPFYVAVSKGFYEEAGIEIEFDYSFETDGIALVSAGQIPFTVASAEQVLLARAQDLPVVYVMTWWQDFPVAVTAYTESGIRTPQDLAGKKIGLPGLFGASYIGLVALLHSAGLAEDEVNLDSIGFNQVEALLAGQEDAIVVYANNEPIQLAARGYDVQTIAVADHVKLASNGLVSNQAVIASNPDLVQRMVTATLRGIQYTLDHPDEAFEISKQFVEGLEDNQEIQRQVFDASLEFWRAPAGTALGFSDLDAWANMHTVLREMQMIQKDVDLSAAFTNQFIR
jgi:NitT/TauT family transport system substrate-binding protein